MGIFNEHSSSSSNTISTSSIHGSPGPRGPPGIGFKVDAYGNYDIENKKLTNVQNGDADHDVMVKSQIEGYVSNKTQYLDGVLPAQVTNNKAVIYSNSGSIHSNALYLKDQYDQEVHFFTEDQDLNQCRLYVPNLKNNDSYGGRRKSSVVVTSIDQTIEGKKVFNNIEVPKPTTNDQACNKKYVDNKFQALVIDHSNFVAKSGDTMTGSLIVPKDNYPVQGDLNKVISYEAQREIFLSKKEGGRMEQPIDMGGFTIENLKSPTADDHATSKVYVDNSVKNKADLMDTTTQTFKSRLQVPDLNPSSHTGSDVVNLKYINNTFLNKNTGGELKNPITFQSSLSNNQKQIHNIGTPQYDSSAANKRYVNSEINKIPKVDTTHYIKKDGFVPMEANLNMNNHNILNVKTPLNNTDATNKASIDDKLSNSHLISSSKENDFKYLLDADESSSEYNVVVNGVTDFSGSPHRNKKVYDITLHKDAGTNNYRSRIGFNIYPIDIGQYTIIFEFFPPEMNNIQISSQATTAYINRQVSNYSKLLVQFSNTSKDTPDQIFFTMHGVAVATPVQAYLVVYGTKEWSDSVNPEMYDHEITDAMFEYKNEKMQMQTDLDLNNHKIINLDDPLNEGDACNKRSLNIVETKLNDLSYYTKDYIYRHIFGTNFYDLEETSMFNLVQGVSGVVISGLRPNLVLGTDRFINSYSPKYGLQLSTKTHIQTVDIFNQNTSFTFFMSFLHDTTKTCEISWSNTLNLHIKFYPRYQITNNKLKIVVPAQDYETIFTSDFQNKQNFVWICYDGSKNLHKFSLSNYSSRVQQSFIAPVNFQSRQLEIDYDGYVKKVGLTNKFIDIDGLEFHKIILEEKRNGAYLE